MKYTLTDRLMWHFMQGTCYKVLQTKYPEWDYNQLRKTAKDRFRDILTSTPSIGSYREKQPEEEPRWRNGVVCHL